MDPCIFEKVPIDRLTRTIADFIYPHLSSSSVDIEIEAKFGILIDKHSNQRINFPILNEVVLADGSWYRFESNMSAVFLLSFLCVNNTGRNNMHSLMNG